MKIVKRICKKKKKSFASRCLSSGTTTSWYEHILFWYSHLPFPDQSFCVTAAEVASPVLLVISTNHLINLISTEFYKHKYTLIVLYSHPKYLHTYKTDRSNVAFAHLPLWRFLYGRWAELSWAEGVPLGLEKMVIRFISTSSENLIS